MRPPVVMAIIGGMEMTLRTIRSLGTGLPYILFDNGSPPGTLDFAADLPDCEVLRSSRNIGVSKAWNALFETAFRRGADGAFCTNNDIVFLPRAYETLLEVASRDPDAGIVSASELPDDFPKFVQAAEIPAYRFSMFYLRRAVWDRIGPFDERFRPAYWEDFDYILRAKAAGVRMIQTVRSAGFHAHFGSTQGFAGRLRRVTAFRANQWRFILKNGWHALPERSRRLM